MDVEPEGLHECLSCGQHHSCHCRGHKRSTFCSGGRNDPVAITTQTIYLAVTMCWHTLRTLHTLSYLILTIPGRGRVLANSVFEGSNRSLKRSSNLPQVTKPVSITASLTPAAKPLSLTTVPWTVTVVAGFLTLKKASSLLITDFITPETGGLGGKKIAWLLRPKPFQKEDTRWAPCQPRWPTWSLHLSDFWLSLPVQSVCNMDSGTGPTTNQIFFLELGRLSVAQSCWGHPNLSVLSHTVLDDTFEHVGLEVLNRPWGVGSGRRDSRQCMLTCTHGCWGLV